MFGQNGARHIYNRDADWYKKQQLVLTIPRAIKKANPAYELLILASGTLP